MKPFYACNSPEHAVSRRQFLAGTAAGALGAWGLAGLVHPAAAQQLRRTQRRVLMVWLAGGVRRSLTRSTMRCSTV